MANGTSIDNLKNKIISEIINDDDIVLAIDAQNIEDNEELVNTHIFNFAQDIAVIEDNITFITVQVHLYTDLDYSLEHSRIYPTVEIWIYSHVSHMVVDNIPKITANRNDYISILLDSKFNGKSGFGLGKLRLISNSEGTYQKNWVYRKMLFKTTDLNDSLCEVDCD